MGARNALAKMQYGLQKLTLKPTGATVISLYIAIAIALASWAGAAPRRLLLLLVWSLAQQLHADGLHRCASRIRGGVHDELNVHKYMLDQPRSTLPELVRRPALGNGRGGHNAFIHRGGRAKWRGDRPLRRRGSDIAAQHDGDDAAPRPEAATTATQVDYRITGYPWPPWRSPGREETREKLTVADVIKRRMIPQPPSLEYTRRVLARKPWKRMNIHARIKQEKIKIEETDQFLDRYFHGYLSERGNDAASASGMTTIDAGMFKPKTTTAAKTLQANVYKYDVDELLHIWNTKGGHFYTSIPKTVAMLQIVRRMAQQSGASADTLKLIREHACFKRLVGSVVRHMKYMSRIELPRHLKNYDKLLNMVPRFNKQQMVTLFAALADMGFNNEKVVEQMLNYSMPYKNFTPEEMRAVIMACIAMRVDPSPIVEEYIEKLKTQLKELGTPTTEKNSEAALAVHGHPDTQMEAYLDMLRICNKADHMDNWLFTHIAEFVKEREHLSLNDAVEATALFTEVQHLDEALFQHLFNALTGHSAAIKRKSTVKKLLQALGQCHYKAPKKLVDHIAAAVLKDVRSYSLVELTAAVRQLSFLDCYNEELCRTVFNLGIFTNPPSVKVLQQINLQLNQKKAAYAAYLHPVASSTLNVIFGNVYQTYLGYRLLGKSPDKFEFNRDATTKLKDIHSSSVRNWTFGSSSLHIQVRDLLRDAFGIDCAIEHVTDEGLVVDIAILPSSLEKLTEKIGARDFLKDKRCAIEVHGPFHYLQKSTKHFPPPMDNKTQFKERVLRASGWDVSHLHYWSFVPWMMREHKIKVLAKLLPVWVSKLCKETPGAQGT